MAPRAVAGAATWVGIGLALLASGCGTGPFQKVAGVGGGGTVGDSTALVQLAIFPKTTTIAPGDAVQFTVTGTLANGATVTPLVTYSARGGAITVDGLFTPGAAPATDTVVATQRGGVTGNPPCCADTAVVTVSASLRASLTTRPAGIPPRARTTPSSSFLPAAARAGRR
jgi:hypothetical protein